MKAFLLALVRRDVNARLRERWALILWMAIPILIGVLIGSLVAGQGGGAPVAHLLLVDEDDSLISGFVGSAFSQGDLADMLRLEPVSDVAIARERMNAGEASALLIIPKGFGDAVIADQPTMLELITNPSQTILPGIIEEIVTVMVEGGFYLRQLFGPEIDSLMEIIDNSEESGPSDASIAMISVSVNQAVQSLEQYLFPPILTVTVVEPEQSEQEGPGYLLLLLPGIVLMSLMFAAQSLSDDFWKERQAGTLRRLAVAPHSLTALTAGKAVAVAVLLAGTASVVLGLGFAVLDLPWLRLPLSVLWLSLGGVLLFAIMSLLSLLAPSRRAASIITSAVLFPLLMVGGSFFPLEALPGWLARIGGLTPNGLILVQLKDYLTGRSGVLDLAAAAAVLIPITVAMLWLCRVRLTTFARGQ